MKSRNVSARPRFMCLALVSLLFLSTAPLLTAASTPVAVVAPDGTTVLVGEEVTFTGEGSYCRDGNITSYLWDLGDGTRASGLTVTHAYSSPGTYTVTLVVTANDGIYGTDTGTIYVLDRTGDVWTAGIESVTSEKATYAIGETINATVLVERGLDMLTAVWEGRLALAVLDATGDTVHQDVLPVWLAHGGAQQTLYFELALDYAGDYLLSFSLYWRNDTLVDTKGLEVSVARDIFNKAPIAIIDPASQTVEVGAEATLDGGRSYDPDNDETTHVWELGDGTTIDGPTATHAYRVPGTYNVTLTVTDEHGATGTATALVVVVARDLPPGDVEVWISTLLADKGTYRAGDVMDVTVVVTRGSDLLTWVWEGTLVLELLDMEGVQLGGWDRAVYLPHGGVTQTFSFSVDLVEAGDRILVANLYWMDGSFVDARQLNVTVTQEDRNQPPTAVVDPPEQTVGVGAVAKLDGSASHDDDGSIASHRWEFGDGTVAEGPLATHAYLVPGVYSVTLTVTDDDGATAVAYARVEVLSDGPPPEEPEAWIVSIDTGGLVNGSGTVTVEVMRGGDMLDYVWTGTLALEVIGGVVQTQPVSLATGGEARSHVFRLSLNEAGDHVLRATLLGQDGATVDVVQVTVSVFAGPGEGNDGDDGRLSAVPAPAVAAAGLLVVLGALGATEVGKASLLGLLVPLYSKLRKEDVLDHFTRGKIYGYILANPGDHYNSIQKALGIPNGTFAYHLHVLEKEGYIRSTREGTNRVFFPAGMRIPDNERTLRASQRLIVERILEEPGISQKEIASSLGVSAATVSYHIRGLLDMGVVETERRGMSLKYYINRELLVRPA